MYDKGKGCNNKKTKNTIVYIDGGLKGLLIIAVGE